MVYQENEQHQHNWERMMTPMDGDREPQLNCTICGKRAGFGGCLRNARNEDGSDTDQTEGELGRDQTYNTADIGQMWTRLTATVKRASKRSKP